MKSKNKGKDKGWYGTFPNEGHDGTPPNPLRKQSRGEGQNQPRVRKPGTGAGTSCPHNPKNHNKLSGPGCMIFVEHAHGLPSN